MEGEAALYRQSGERRGEGKSVTVAVTADDATHV